MGQRLELHAILVDILGSDNVYFQPPPSSLMSYPCIRYESAGGETNFANNSPYRHVVKYELTVIDRDPDSDIPLKVAMLPMCSRDRFYTADQLNHDVFTLFF